MSDLLITWAGSTTEAGQSQDTVGGSSYTRIGMVFYIGRPLKITAVKADIYANATYSMYITDTVAAGGNTLFDIESSKVVGTAPAEITFTPASPFILFPGKHILSLDIGSSVQCYFHSDNEYSCSLWASYQMILGSTLNSTVTMPVRFVAYQPASIGVI